GQSSPSRSVAQVAVDLAARLAPADGDDIDPASWVTTAGSRYFASLIAPADPEAAWSAIAEVKNGHVLRVGVADFAGVLGPLAVCAELTAIAEACLDGALAIVRAQLTARHGVPPGDARLAVLGLGKLGGYELGYAADLDVVFVYTGDDGESDGAAPLATAEWFSRCAQRLLGAPRPRTPRRRPHEIDPRP